MTDNDDDGDVVTEEVCARDRKEVWFWNETKEEWPVPAKWKCEFAERVYRIVGLNKGFRIMCVMEAVLAALPQPLVFYKQVSPDPPKPERQELQRNRVLLSNNSNWMRRAVQEARENWFDSLRPHVVEETSAHVVLHDAFTRTVFTLNERGQFVKAHLYLRCLECDSHGADVQERYCTWFACDACKEAFDRFVLRNRMCFWNFDTLVTCLRAFRAEATTGGLWFSWLAHSWHQQHTMVTNE